MCQKRRQDIKGQNKNESSGSNLQVAAAGEDEEDLGVVDWQQCTAGWEAAHGDIEESAFWGFVVKLRCCSVSRGRGDTIRHLLRDTG